MEPIMEQNQYRITKKSMTSLECSTFYNFYIEKRRWKWIGLNYKLFWKEVIDESKTDMSGNVQGYPYVFNSEKDAKEFLINKIIGKDNWRDGIIDSILK